MNALLIVLRKAIVFAFFRRNAGLFFAVLLLIGGFMRAGDHIALAEAAVHSPFMLGLYQTLWVLYTVFATRFAVNTIRQTEVLYLLRLVPGPKRWLVLLTVQYGLLNPILVYTLFVGWISWQQHTWGSTVQLSIGALLILISPLFWLDHALRTPNRKPLTLHLGIDWHKRFTTPYRLFFIRELLENQPVLFFTTKAGTCLIILGVLALYPTDDYDSRLVALGALLTALIHSSLLYHLYRFEHERLSLLRNLPVPIRLRLLTYALMFALLLIPEAAVLLRYWPVGVSVETLAGTWFFTHGILLLQFTLLLPRHRAPDQLMPLIFGLLLIFFFCIMYQFSVWGLGLASWIVASGVFARFYPKSAWATEATD